jgi:hypothetical protein
VIRELEQASHRAKEIASTWLRMSAGMQVGAPDIPDKKRVAGEDEPRLLCSTSPVGDEVGVVRRRVPRRSESANDGVSKLDDVTVIEGGVGELDPSLGWKVGRRSRRLDQRRKPRNVVGLDMRLEDSRDRSTRALSRLDVPVHKLNVGIDDRELRAGEAAEEVAGAGRLLVQERAQDHCLSQA